MGSLRELSGRSGIPSRYKHTQWDTRREGRSSRFRSKGGRSAPQGLFAQSNGVSRIRGRTGRRGIKDAPDATACLLSWCRGVVVLEPLIGRTVCTAENQSNQESTGSNGTYAQRAYHDH